MPTDVPSRHRPLSGEDVAAYHRDGYLLPRLRVAERFLAPMRDAVDDVVRRNPDRRPENLINPHLTPLTDGTNPFRDFALDPWTLDLVEQVIGPDIVLWSTHLLCKPEGDGQAVPWHQDGAYWPIRPLATCTLWLALDRADEGNGCMRVIPCSHLADIDHARVARSSFRIEIPAESIDEGAAVDVVRDPGEFELHDVRTVHGSRANRSGRRRAAIIFRYMPSTSVFERDPTWLEGKVSYRIQDTPIFLARGIDRSGRNDFRFGHP
jgi:hypothetical protein